MGRFAIRGLCGFLLIGSLQAQTPVVLWSTLAPGFNASFNTPFLDDAGQAAYLNLTNGFTLGTPGAPALRNLQPFIQSAGVGLDVTYCIVGDNGHVGYMLDHGLVDDPGTGQVLASEDGQVPGLPAGVLFDATTFYDNMSVPWHFAMSPSGVFVLSATLKGTGIVNTGQSNINDQVVLRGPGNNFIPIARASDPATGLPAGYVFVGQLNRRFDAVINSAGVTAIRSRATLWQSGSPFPVQNAEGIWLHDPVGGLQLGVTAVSQGTNPRGDIAPGTGGGRFTDITLGPSINDQGYIAFSANTFNFSANPPYKSGIWSGPTNDLQPVHLFSAPVPGLAGVTFDNPYDNITVKLGSGRTVCFLTLLAGAGVTTANNVGLFIGTATNDVRLLARLGDQVPGLAAGITYSSLPGDAIVIFGTNRVAIRALVSGPGVSQGVNDRCLCITDDQGNLKAVARTGDTLHTGAGDLLIAGDFVLQHGTGQDGLASSGNRRNQLALFMNAAFNASYVYILNVSPAVPTPPRIEFSYSRAGLTLSWPTNYALQYTPTLVPFNWTVLNVTSPYTAPLTNPQAFYRIGPQGPVLPHP